MATISNERHLRYILLLGEGGTLVLKEILERETVKSSKSLGNLLDANKNALTRRIEKHILPKVFGPDANQDAWDIQLLSTVILQLFKKSLTKDENNCITKLKELRNELAHASSLSMDAEEYDDDRKELASVLIQLSNGLDKSVHDKCQNFIKDFATGPIDIQSATERVKEFSKYDDKIQTELDKLTGKLEDVSTTVKDVSVKVDSVAVEMKDVKQMLQKMIASNTENFHSFQVVGTEMELRGPNDHLTNMAEESLVRLFRSALERTGGDRDLTKIGHAINVILSEIESCNKVKVLGVDQQCIVIKMRCNNCQGLLELLEYLEGSRFKRRLHELVAALEITYKARFHLSSQIALGDLKNLLWNLRHLDEDKHGSKDDDINAERIQKEQHEAIYTEGKPTRIKVCGLPSDVTTDFLTLFFENKRKGGGVPVRKVSFYNDISTAVIEFESPEGVETVLSRRNIEMMGQAVTVVLYQPELARTVEVRGPTQIVCEGNIDLLKSHFSNVGAVMKILYDRGRNSVLVTFETEEVAKKMLMRTHVINGKLLEVSLHTCSVREIYFRDRILLKGISSSTSEDNISHFLEATTGIKPMRIAYHKSNDDTALIEMESMPDITELKEVCKVHTVDGVHLDVCSVAISNCILVENVPNHFTSELLEHYFENKVRSGGDLVEKIIKIEGLSALVYFKDKIAVADVLEHFHQLDIETLKVSLFYECLQLTEKDAFDLSVPDPVTLFGIDNDKLEFIKRDPPYGKLIHGHMQACFAEIVRIQKGNVEINCTILPNAIKSNRLVMKWGKNAEDVFQKCLDGITIISVQQSSAVVRVVNMSLRETDQNITYIADEKNSTVTLIGETKTVKTIVEFMNTTATETEDLRIEEKVELFDSVEVKMLQKMGYKKIAHIKVPDVEISLSNKNSIITMKGMKSDIEKAKLQLFDMKNKFVCFVIEGMSSQEKELLMKQETINYVEEILRKENVGDVEWNIRNGQYLVVCCPASNDIAYCINIFKTSVVMSVISLRGHSNPLRECELWENKVQELYEMYGGKMTINVEEHAFVQLCSTNDISQPLVEDITSVIQSCKKQSDIKDVIVSSEGYASFSEELKGSDGYGSMEIGKLLYSYIRFANV